MSSHKCERRVTAYLTDRDPGDPGHPSGRRYALPGPGHDLRKPARRLRCGRRGLDGRLLGAVAPTKHIRAALPRIERTVYRGLDVSGEVLCVAFQLRASGNSTRVRGGEPLGAWRGPGASLPCPESVHEVSSTLDAETSVDYFATRHARERRPYDRGCRRAGAWQGGLARRV